MRPEEKQRIGVTKGAGYLTPKGQVVRFQHFGEPILFTIDNPADLIQRYHARGRFFEQEELNVIRQHFPLGGVFVDIGTNIGNHSIYVSKFCRPSKIISFEPNPVAIKTLMSNIILNGVADIFDLSHLGVGLGAKDGEGFKLNWDNRNVGAAVMSQGDGEIAVRTGDTELGGQGVSFMKIDVEGMEMGVLKGLEQTLARTRPIILIEVDHVNKAEFDGWLKTAKYRVEVAFERFSVNQNFLIKPLPAAQTDKKDV